MLKYRKNAVFVLCMVLMLAGCSKKEDERWSSSVPIVTTQEAENKPETEDGDDVSTEYNYSYETPSFNYESGFYDDKISLEISHENKEFQIRYTLDGSTPDFNSDVYSSPVTIVDRTQEENVLSAIKGIAPAGDEYQPKFKINKGTVVKAAVFDKNGVSGPVVTNTYFVGQSQEEEYNGLPVISISTDAENLFDYEKGIYMLGKAFDDWKSTTNIYMVEEWSYEGNYSQRGREWERPVVFELIEPDGKVGYEGVLGLRIMGNATRSYAQKSFRLYAREEYSGEKNIKYPLIPNATKENDDTQILKKYRTFLLRNGGNDCSYSKVRDPLVQRMVSDRNLTTQDSRPAVVFINGEYWGLYAIEEDYSDNFIQHNYDIDNKDAVIIKCGELEEGEESDMDLYRELTGILESDLTNADTYARLCQIADIQNFADYFVTLIYTANEDCLLNYNNNWRLWRSRTVTDLAYQDGKWRYMLYDTEFSLGLYRDAGYGNHDSLQGAMSGNVFENLIKNEDFKKLFVTTFMDMRNENFNPVRALSILDELDSEYGPEIGDSVERFGPGWVANSGDPKKQYQEQIGNIRSFLNTRYSYTPGMLKKVLKLSGEAVDVTLRTSKGGSIIINSVSPDLSQGSWTGQYFTDYPVSLTAVCEEGYEFTGWSGGITETSESVIMSFSEAVEVTANFSEK